MRNDRQRSQGAGQLTSNPMYLKWISDYVDGIPIADIAAAAGVPSGRVKDILQTTGVTQLGPTAHSRKPRSSLNSVGEVTPALASYWHAARRAGLSATELAAAAGVGEEVVVQYWAQRNPTVVYRDLDSAVTAARFPIHDRDSLIDLHKRLGEGALPAEEARSLLIQFEQFLNPPDDLSNAAMDADSAPLSEP